jgi:hypothetical protein
LNPSTLESGETGERKNLYNNSDINFKILFQGGHTKQVFERETFVATKTKFSVNISHE